MLSWKGVVAGALAAGLFMAQAVQAAPVSYNGHLVSDVAAQGQVQGSDSGWWSFWATAGDTVTITVNRLSAEMDPAFQLFFGYGEEDTMEFYGGADDDIPPLEGYEGPGLDPSFSFTLFDTGYFSIRVFDVLGGFGGWSEGGERQFERLALHGYQIIINGATGRAPVSEPAALALLGAGLFSLGFLRRRKAS